MTYEASSAIPMEWRIVYADIRCPVVSKVEMSG